MNKADSSHQKIKAVLFVVIQIILFPLIQIPPADISALFSYISIILVAIFAMTVRLKERDGHLVRLGIILTLVADFFLILCEDRMLEGVICFFFVQMCYFSYLLVREERVKLRVLNVIFRIALSIILIAVAAIVLGNDIGMLEIASVLYYGNLLMNCIFAFTRFGEEKLFAIGLALFAMCDMCIGVDVLFDTYLNSNALSFIFSYPYANVSWIFYQPSQVLIALHLMCKGREV